MKNTIKTLTINGMGIALFIALSMCLRIPIFQNYYLCLGYVVMSVYCYSVGIISGTIVGVIGTILYCFLIGGLRGMPGWALGNIAIGLVMGCSFHLSKALKNKIAKTILSVIGIVLGVTIGILGIKSGVECLLYTQPFFIRLTTNMYAFIADIFVLIVSLPICYLLDKPIRKTMKG